jgi:hypothetical protein
MGMKQGMNLHDYILFLCEQYDKYFELSVETKKKGLKEHSRWYMARMLSFLEVIEEAERCGLIPKEKRTKHEQK